MCLFTFPTSLYISSIVCLLKERLNYVWPTDGPYPDFHLQRTLTGKEMTLRAFGAMALLVESFESGANWKTQQFRHWALSGTVHQGNKSYFDKLKSLPGWLPCPLVAIQQIITISSFVAKWPRNAAKFSNCARNYFVYYDYNRCWKQQIRMRREDFVVKQLNPVVANTVK